MRHLQLQDNSLTGNIPAELGNMSGPLQSIDLSGNELTGGIPPELGNLGVQFLSLHDNKLSGSVPPELGDLQNLTSITLFGNQLRGEIPVELADLDTLVTAGIDYNSLWTDDPDLQAFLDSVDNCCVAWDEAQTIAPMGILVSPTTSTSATVTWTPIPYSSGSGRYWLGPQSDYSDTIFADGFESGDLMRWSGGGSVQLPTTFETSDKIASSIVVDGLQPNTTYEFVIRTITDPFSQNQNTVVSDPSPIVSFSTEP